MNNDKVLDDGGKDYFGDGVMVIFPTVQPLLDPTRGNAACTFSPECPGSHM